MANAQLEYAPGLDVAVRSLKVGGSSAIFAKAYVATSTATTTAGERWTIAGNYVRLSNVVTFTADVGQLPPGQYLDVGSYLFIDYVTGTDVSAVATSEAVGGMSVQFSQVAADVTTPAAASLVFMNVTASAGILSAVPQSITAVGTVIINMASSIPTKMVLAGSPAFAEVIAQTPNTFTIRTRADGSVVVGYNNPEVCGLVFG